MPTAMRPGAQKMARKLAKLCIRGDMNDAIEATAVLAALFCKLAAREDNIPFDEVFVELMQHAAQLVDDGTVTLADFRKDR